MKDTLHKVCDTALAAVGVFLLAGVILLVTQRGGGAHEHTNPRLCAEIKEQLLAAVDAEIITEAEAIHLANNCRRSYERGR